MRDDSKNGCVADYQKSDRCREVPVSGGSTSVSTLKVRCLNQLRTPISIWNGVSFLSAWLGQEFRLWNNFNVDREVFI